MLSGAAVLPVPYQHPLDQWMLGTGLAIAPPLCAELALVCPTGWWCWGHGASCAGRVSALLGTQGKARGQFLCGSHQFEYMSCSSFNYSNWLSEGPADARSVSEGEPERLSCLMLHLWRSPCLHLAICHQPRGMPPVPMGTRLM